MDLVAKALVLRALVVGVMAGALFLAGCGGGGKSSSATGATAGSSSNTLKRAEVTVLRTAAQAPAMSMLARAASLLGWPQVAEAAACTVTGGGVTGVSAGGDKFILTNPTLNADNSLDITVSCGADASGTLHLTGLTPGAAIQVKVEARPGRLRVRSRVDDVNSEVSVSGPSEPSEPSVSRSGPNSGKG
jgi:hypothetical protein